MGDTKQEDRPPTAAMQSGDVGQPRQATPTTGGNNPNPAAPAKPLIVLDERYKLGDCRWTRR